MRKAEGTHKKQSKGKQAQGPKENGLSEECNFDDSIRKKRRSERRRRKRINAKLKTLQQLIPNSDKRDQASILGDAIKCIQSLKFQLDMILKLSGRNQLQATCLPQTHPSMMSPAYGIRAARQFQMGPSDYGLMVPPQSVQVASIRQPRVAAPPILCPQGYFPSAGATGSFPPHFDPHQQHSVPSSSNQPPPPLT
ncbi:hypothetical protein Cgig2_031654 [Carnegiea gigantea]|uniref:BHLH domain-containing protein n=1 Tax=Carnegiea gigantea TaxID=171969 RepID=A0A9Q1QPH3_9CARY|nr:hypothetical protein Cgig2_031654 [Carnegiea gigantea]